MQGSKGHEKLTPIVTQMEDWDTQWVLRSEDFGSLPESALAKQHDGWDRLEMSPRTTDPRVEDRQPLPSTDYFPSPTVSLPTPRMRFDFRMAAKLDRDGSRVRALGPGVKDLTAITSGRWSASFGQGIVRAGGHNLQPPQVPGQSRSKVDTAFQLETTDNPPVILELRTRGYISYQVGALAGILNPTSGRDPDPREYTFRMAMSLRSEDPKYAEQLNLALWIGSGAWRSDELILDAYRIS